MRASLDGPVGAGLKKDRRISEWFWDHEIGFCKRHCDRDRQRHIAECLAGEPRVEPMSPTALDPVPSS